MLLDDREVHCLLATLPAVARVQWGLGAKRLFHTPARSIIAYGNELGDELCASRSRCEADDAVHIAVWTNPNVNRSTKLMKKTPRGGPSAHRT